MISITDSFKWQSHFFSKSDAKINTPMEMNSHYFIWGANSYNYNYKGGKLLNYVDRITGEKKSGSGQAGKKGPTRGKAHPNYIGIISIFKPGDSLKDIYSAIDERFIFLKNKLAKGANIIFPIDSDFLTNKKNIIPKKITNEFIKKNHGLGKGVARDRLKSNTDIERWNKIQARIATNIDMLFN